MLDFKGMLVNDARFAHDCQPRLFTRTRYGRVINLVRLAICALHHFSIGGCRYAKKNAVKYINQFAVLLHATEVSYFVHFKTKYNHNYRKELVFFSLVCCLHVSTKSLLGTAYALVWGSPWLLFERGNYCQSWPGMLWPANRECNWHPTVDWISRMGFRCVWYYKNLPFICMTMMSCVCYYLNNIARC